MIHYLECGRKDAKTVIFIHGGFTNSESYAKQYRFLNDYHCIFVDLPNHGKSRKGKDGAYSFSKAADEVMKVMDFFSPKEKVWIISHSYGGLVVKIIMERVPERIDKVVIGSTNIKRSLLYRMYTSKIGCVILSLQSRKRFLKEHISWKLVCDTQKSAWQNFSLPKEKPGQREIPALLLVGQYDIQDIKKSMELWEAYLVNSKTVVIEGAGYNYFWENAGQVNSVIEKFLIGNLQ